jgi:hypothetical protein
VNGESPEAAISFAISSLVGQRGISPTPGLTLDPGSDAEGGLSASGRGIGQLNGLCPFDVLADDGEGSGLAEKGEATEFCDGDRLLCDDCLLPFACVTGLGVGATFMTLNSPWLFKKVPPKSSSNELFCIKSE